MSGRPPAAEIASALDAPLDLVLVRKIGVPLHPELAMGAVADGADPLVVRNEDVIRFPGSRSRSLQRFAMRSWPRSNAGAGVISVAANRSI